jgi:Plasmid pRiA4b ORF-3-like protein
VTGATTHILRASLKARVYRDIEIEAKSSLYALAEAITNAFKFDFDHAFGFFSRLTGNVFASTIRYELFVDSDANGKSHSVKRTTVARAFPRVGSKMLFLFDYGDEWWFQIEVTGLREAAPDAFYPRVIATAGKAPRQYSVSEDEV